MLIQHTATAPTNTSEAIAGVELKHSHLQYVFIMGSAVGMMEIHDGKAEY